jgi:neutral ceramidase
MELVDQPLWLGLARTDITACVEGMSMWGWGAIGNVAVGVAAPLHARAIVIAEGESAPPFVLVTVELGMVSEALRRASLEALRRRGVDVDAHRFLITATHTHSGPGGFSTYFFYQMAGPGFSQPLLDRLVVGIVDAVLAALGSLAPGRVRTLSDDLPLVEPVCFNRALAAYNRNEDVTPVAADRADEAVSRRMTVLRLEDVSGRPRGVIAIFAVHGTSVHADNDLLHPDNPGIAARECELAANREGDRDFVAVFMQSGAGDVSPNYRWDARRGMQVGRYDDDFESAAACGEAQARHAMRLLRSARTAGVELKGPLDAELHTVPFHETTLDDDLARAAGWPRTSIARLGSAFSLGTAEGPGPLRKAPVVARALGHVCTMLRQHDDPAHFPKHVLWDFGVGKDNHVLGRMDVTHPVVGMLPDRRLRFFRSAIVRGDVMEQPWAPHVLPFQILRIGTFAAATVPFEPTTVAARRIRATVARALAASGVREVAVLGYANAYASYLTTHEEYEAQAYEGATTLFGRASLGGVCTRLREVAAALSARSTRAETAAPRERALATG